MAAEAASPSCAGDLGLTSASVGRCEQFVPAHELHARTALLFAARTLEGVDGLPTRVQHGVDPARDQELVDGSASTLGQPAAARVLEEELDRLRGVLLVRSDHAGRAPLDPPGAVETRDRLALLVEHTAAGIRD